MGIDAMLIKPSDLLKEPLFIQESIPAGAIVYAPDTQQIGPLPVEGKVDLIVEHRGPQEEVQDLRVRASYDGRFEVACARCLEPVSLPLKGEFDLLFRPEHVDAESGERAISEDETEIGYYGKNGLELQDVLREQVLLSLPARTLCAEDCKGLCARCGENLNVATCSCVQVTSDSRWSSLEALAGTLRN